MLSRRPSAAAHRIASLVALTLWGAACTTAPDSGLPSLQPLPEEPGVFLGEQVQFLACDSAQIAGDLVMPEGVTDPPIAILVHDVDQTHAVWAPVVEALREAGIGSLAMDLRGHGASTTMEGQSMVRTEFEESDWLDSHRDVIRAGEILADRFPSSRATLVGLRFGGSLAAHAVRHMRSVQGLVLLGAGSSYNGITLPLGRRQRGKNVLVVPLGSDDDGALATGREELPDLTVFTGARRRFTPGRMVANEALWSAVLDVIRATP